MPTGGAHHAGPNTSAGSPPRHVGRSALPGHGYGHHERMLRRQRRRSGGAGVTNPRAHFVGTCRMAAPARRRTRPPPSELGRHLPRPAASLRPREGRRSTSAASTPWPAPKWRDPRAAAHGQPSSTRHCISASLLTGKDHLSDRFPWTSEDARGGRSPGRPPLGSQRSVSTQMPSSRATRSTSCTSVGSTGPMAASSIRLSSR